ncbi:hypothetical protein PGTUg99_033132 [Puccinia graminis f. sp. tritici]|uniref:Uncharacterized protein n=1 Tax=Puccinia graminis f. sp. tritici TaxID=56615 RepID=A0A5B0RF56_PUCGR|nr:hypothetical protein PGTUg99_033132 [Puccinia graminis f. sp. tritici]
MSVCADGLQCDFRTGDPQVKPFLSMRSKTQGFDAPHAQPMIHHFLPEQTTAQIFCFHVALTHELLL